jgi:hypothetical protein
MLSTCGNVSNSGLLLLAVLSAILCVSPQTEESAGVRSALLKHFSETYVDFSRQALSVRLVSLDDLTSEFQKIVDAYFAAPSESAGEIRHLTNEKKLQLPVLSMGYRPSTGASIVEVSSPLEFGSSALSKAVNEFTKSHPNDCIVTANLEIFLVVQTTSGAQTFKGMWSGTVDVHQSFMRLQGRFWRPELGYQWIMCAVASTWLAACSISWYFRDTFLEAAIAGLHMTAAGSCLLSALSIGNQDVSKLLVAVACFVSCNVLSWFTMQSILPAVCIVQRALTTASGHLWWYVVGVAPIFCAFAIAGSLLFSVDEVNFGTVPRSFVTLFCSVFGDSLIDVFTAIDEFNTNWVWWLSARLFFCCFLGLFITTILNVALSVMQDSVAVSEHRYILSQSASPPAARMIRVDKILDLLA